MVLAKEYHCDMGHGFLFGPPLAPGEMLGWCRNDLRMAEEGGAYRAPAGASPG